MRHASSYSFRPFAILSLMTAMILVFVAAGCKRNAPQAPEKKAPKVFFEYAREEVVTDFEEFTGRLEAVKKVDIQSRVTGYLVDIHFEEGGRVKKGDLLFEIDPTPYEVEHAKAKAMLTLAEAKLFEPADKREREKRLFDKNAGSEEEYKRALALEKVALADIDVAKRAVDVAKTWLDYTKIRAPFDGIVSRTMIDPKNLVKADTTVLTTIVSETPIYGYFDVDEGTHLRLKRLQTEKKIASAGSSKVPVKLSLADEDEEAKEGDAIGKRQKFQHEGFIDFEDIVIDPATGTRRMRGRFDNKNGLFTPGMFVRVRLQVGLPHKAVTVAEQAIGTDQGNKFVYVVDDKNQVEYRKVNRTGALIKGRRVIEEGEKPGEGVKAGERVIVSGLQKIRMPPPDESNPDAKKARVIVDAVERTADTQGGKAKEPPHTVIAPTK